MNGRQLQGLLLLSAAAVSLGAFGVSHLGASAAVALIATGLALGAGAGHGLRARTRDHYRIVPTILIVTLSVATVSLSRFLHYREGNYIRSLVKDQSETIESKLKLEITNLSAALHRFATRVSYLGLKDKGFLRVDGQSYLNQIRGLRRLGITDRDLHVVWSYPDTLDGQVKDFDQSTEAARRDAFVDSTDGDPMSFSRLITLRSGEPGFLVPVPLRRNVDITGFLYGTVAAATLFEDVDDADLHISISETQQTILANEKPLKIFDNQRADVDEFKFDATFTAGVANWIVAVTPTPAFVNRNRTHLPLIVFVTGLLLAIVIGVNVQTAARSLAQNEFDSIWRQAVLDGADYSIISTDVDGVIQTFNHSAEKLLGYRAEEVVNKMNPSRFHDPAVLERRTRELNAEFGTEVAPGFDTLVTRLGRTGAPDERDGVYVRKDGTRVPVMISVSPLRAATGEILGYIGIAADQTERRRGEGQLREIKERLERVVESTGSGIWERDYDAKTPGYFDARGKALFGFAADEDVSFAELDARVEPEQAVEMRRRIEEHVALRTPRFELEFQTLPRDGYAPRWLRGIGQVKIVDGRPTTLTATFNDVTLEVENRRRLETALKDARSATEAKSAFLANMSHEIRTPLAGILGLTRLVQQTQLTTDQRDNLDSVVRSGENLLTIINDILDFAKVDAGKMDLEVIPFDLQRLLEDTTKVLGYSARQKNIGMVLETPENMVSKFRGDPGRLGQVLINLISNAIKFTNQGQVTLRLRQLVLKKDVYRLRFEVQDTGIGIPAEAVPRMFQAFSQADLSTARKFGGTGLGLSISKRLIDLMGGQIGVHSEQNRGSTFWFEVPMHTDDAAVVVETRPSVVKTSFPAKILIAEDNVINQKVALATLKKLGYQPQVVNNGQEAVDAVAREKYDLVLMDCQMPVVDGYEATKILRLHGDHKKIPIIAMTAHVMAGEREKCLAAGMSDYITKPFDVRTLHALIERYLAA